MGQPRSVLSSGAGTLLQLAGHKDIEENERTDVLVREHCSLQSFSEYSLCPAVKSGIYSQYLAAADFDDEGCAKSRRIWPNITKAQSRELLCQTRANAYKISTVCTGAGLYGITSPDSAYPTIHFAEVVERKTLSSRLPSTS